MESERKITSKAAQKAIIAVGLVIGLFSSASVFAEPVVTDSKVIVKSVSVGSVYVAPVSLSKNSVVTIIAPSKYAHVAEKLFDALKETHTLFTNLFGELPPINTTLRVMYDQDFYASTGAPAWTNALFLHGQIMIPVEDEIQDWDNLIRSVKHEFTHAITATISDNKIPGWLDEGLAQWAEGSENSALRPALVRYLRTQDPVSFTLMQGGFTRMDTRMVAAAYAQSLLATKALAETFGFKKINLLLKNLATESFDDSFRESLGVDSAVFERTFQRRLVTWVKGLSVEAPKTQIASRKDESTTVDTRARADF